MRQADGVPHLMCQHFCRRARCLHPGERVARADGLVEGGAEPVRRPECRQQDCQLVVTTPGLLPARLEGAKQQVGSQPAVTYIWIQLRVAMQLHARCLQPHAGSGERLRG